jgi:hypothetical protein
MTHLTVADSIVILTGLNQLLQVERAARLRYTASLSASSLRAALRSHASRSLVG